MLPLPVEVIAIIARENQNTWINLVLYCAEFRKYAYSREGRAQFLELFTKKIISHCWCEYSIFGRTHREGDLPAIIYTDGSLQWYINGKKHRDGDKPAVVWSTGSMFWYKQGRRHRDISLRKPAVIYANGDVAYYNNGEQLYL